MKGKIVLAFPYHQVSGVPILFARLAERLRALNHKVAIVDFRDGALNSLTSNLDIERKILGTGKHLEFREDEIVIMQASSLEYIRPEYNFNLQTKLIFWHLHPDNLKLNKIRLFNGPRDYKMIRRFQSKKLRSFVRLIHEKKGLISMDETNFHETNQYHGINLSVPICPILIGNSAGRSGVESSTTQWAYLGRVEGFKTLAIKKLVKAISEYNLQAVAKIELFIIGGGEDLEDILKEGRLLNVKLISLGVIKINDYPLVFSRNKISTVCAMGTAIIDAMKAGPAVVKLNYFNTNTNLFPEYFLKVDESSYCLGKELEVADMTAFSNLQKLVELIDKNYKEIIKNQESYLSTFYDNRNNIERFIACVGSSALRFSDIEKYKKRSLIRKAYNYLRYKLYE